VRLAVLDFVDQRCGCSTRTPTAKGFAWPRASGGEQLEHVARAVTRGDRDRGGS
jgi:hypothetical protein